jgi:hypothetical protein
MEKGRINSPSRVATQKLVGQHRMATLPQESRSFVRACFGGVATLHIFELLKISDPARRFRAELQILELGGRLKEKLNFAKRNDLKSNEVM